MKIKTALAGLAGLVLAACTENIDLLEKVPVMGGNSLNIEVTDEFAEAATRADYSGFPVTTFETGDAIGIYAFDGSSYVASNVRFVKQADGSWLPDNDILCDKYYTYYAYFPYRATVYTPSTSGDVDAVDTKFASFISDASNYFWMTDQSSKANFTASNLMIAKGKITGEDDSNITVRFVMDHKRGLAVIGKVANKWCYSEDTETKYSPTVTFTSGNMPYQMGENYYFLTKPDVETTVAGNTMSLSAGIYDKCKVSLTGTPEYTYYLNGSSSPSSKPVWLTVTANIIEGRPTDFTVSASSSGYRTYSDEENSAETAALKANTAAVNVDLSMVDNTGAARASRTTANCYLVHAPGTYKIPLVYGNAIKNGSTNRSAYYTTTNSNTLMNFVNHNDDGIYTGNDTDDPWIKNHSITVNGAKLIWQDVQGMMSSVGVDGDYLTFTVDADNIAPGNAVIAATTEAEGAGDVVWSWHVWVTTETLTNTTRISTDSHDYDIAPVNIGWINTTVRKYTGNICRVQATRNGVTLTFDVTQADETTPLSGYNTYYQWGRKDALVPSNGSDDYNHNTWDISDNLLTSSENNTFYSVVTGANSIGTTIKNPMSLYYNGSNNSPYNEAKYNYWDMENTTLDSSDSKSRAVATVKTVYDPCPPDFCVPTSNCFYYIYSKRSSYFKWDSSIYGCNWTMSGANVFFPASGCRTTNGVSYVSNVGYYWTATPSRMNNSRNLVVSNSANWTYSARAYGYSVRAVAEE